MRNLLAALAVCFAVPAFGQNVIEAGSDVLELRDPTPDCHCVALLFYSNGENELSQAGFYTMELDSISFRVRIEIGGPETLHVYGYENGWTAMLDGEAIESVAVEDGESVTIRILPPLM